MKRRRKYKPIFYIAHTFNQRHYVRDKLIPRLHKIGIRTVNPFYEPDGSWKETRPEVKLADELETSKGVNPEHAKIFLKNIVRKYEDIVETDLRLIGQSDGIIAFMPDSSTGTTCEIWTCGGVFRWLAKQGFHISGFPKPVFLITTSSRLLTHPWIKYATRKVFRDEEKLLKYFKKEMPRLTQELKEKRNAVTKSS